MVSRMLCVKKIIGGAVVLFQMVPNSINAINIAMYQSCYQIFRSTSE